MGVYLTVRLRRTANSRLFAVKCFHRRQEKRCERMRFWNRVSDQDEKDGRRYPGGSGCFAPICASADGLHERDREVAAGTGNESKEGNRMADRGGIVVVERRDQYRRSGREV